MKLIFLFFAVIGLSAAVPHWQHHVRQTRSLRTDVDELLAMIPVDKIVAIYHKYENDADLVKIRAYLKSQDFAAVAHIVSEVPEIQDLVKYLESKDLKVVELINKIADVLGLPHWPGSFSVYSLPRQQRSLRQFLDEVEAVMPVDDLTNFFFDKLANSEDFQELYMKIQGADYQKIHDAAMQHPEIVDMLNRLKAMGVDTLKIWEAIKDIMGWEYHTRQSRSLRTDVDELLAMIPFDKIAAIYHKYENDADLLKIRAYLKSQDFAAVAHIVSGVPEIQDLVKYLESKNLKVVELINKIADVLGLPHWPGSFSVYSLPRQQRSLRQFLDEVEAVMPVDDLTNFFFDKLANSEDFQELYMKIQGADYQKIHDAAMQHPEIVDMLHRLRDMGVDTLKIWAAIKDIMGWE